MENRAIDFFRGRIGETIVETTLLHFGYRVERLGCEISPLSGVQDDAGMSVTPDLLVTDPNDNRKTWLDVKLRPSHPLEIKIEKSQVEALRLNYPGTLLVFVSAYNGSINCLRVEDPVLAGNKPDTEGQYRMGLLDKEWKPLWDYFPMVKKGESTDVLWQELKAVLSDFAGNRMTGSRDTGFFAGEKESLKQYIEKHWHPGMMSQDINGINMDYAELSEVWEHARQIHAFRFAFEMCGESNMDHPAFSQVMDKMLGRIGDKYITIPYRDIKECLTEYPDLYARLQELEKKVTTTPPYDAAVVMMKGLLEIIPPGIGSAYILPEKGSGEEPMEVDFYTVLALLQRRNCLYD